MKASQYALGPLLAIVLLLSSSSCDDGDGGGDDADADVVPDPDADGDGDAADAAEDAPDQEDAPDVVSSCENGLQDGGEENVDCGGDCPACVSEVSQWGITWTFDRGYRVGQFANGDTWVLGPLTVTAMTPEFNGINNGWEVNPVVEGGQGLDAGIGDFDDTLVPGLPYEAAPGQSILKSISLYQGSSDDCYPGCLETAAVLTVLGRVPPDDGATSFRPPYAGDEKPLYSTGDLRGELLPSLEPVDSAPTLDWVLLKYQRPQIEHKTGRVGRITRPVDNYGLEDPYGSHVGRDAADAAMRLMLDDPLVDKMPALIAYVQGGIDRYHAILLGQTWPAGGGYSPGMKLPAAFAAVLLDNQDMKDAVSSTTFFTDDTMIFETSDGLVLFGSHAYWDEERYWDYQVNDPGYNLEYADPYNLIDGGRPTDGYQFCCLSLPWKAAAMAVHLLPDMRPVWNNEAFFEYVERWVSHGTWTQPDPCAPHDGNWDNYGVTYGPDGSGGCILDTDPSDGTGRFPNMHGDSRDDGGYGSQFANDMWSAYHAP